MNFGYSVGDFLAVGQLCWKVYKKCKDSPGNYAELSTEVGALHNVLKETEELLSQQGLTAEQGGKLTTCRQGCDEVLKDLDGLLDKYENMGTKAQRAIKRVGFGMQDMDAIRLRLISNVSMLDAFNNASSHARLEKKLNLLIAEVRAGKREGSVVSTQTFDTAARNNQETWEALRRELEDIGISPAIITEKRQFIIAWFQEAVAAGKLEEDAPSDDDESAISVYESDDSAGESDDDIVPNRKLSSMMIEPRATEPSPKGNPNPSRVRESVHNVQRPPGQATDGSYSRLPQKTEQSRLRVTYLLNKVLRRDRQLDDAAKEGNLSTVRKLLKKGAHVRGKASGATALYYAIEDGHVSMIQLLLEKGADIESKGDSDETALILAVSNGNETIVQILLENGADIEYKGFRDRTALIYAALKGHLSVTQLLLEKGADIESKDSYDATALIYAATHGHSSITRLLLEKGADIESKDRFDSTALKYAAMEGHLSVTQLLLEKGADIESKDRFDSAALKYAAMKGHLSVTQLLLEKGADIESKDLYDATALINAAMKGHPSVTQLLLEKGADIESKDNFGRTALTWAARNGEEATVQVLLDKGAKVNAKDAARITALHRA